MFLISFALVFLLIVNLFYFVFFSFAASSQLLLLVLFNVFFFYVKLLLAFKTSCTLRRMCTGLSRIISMYIDHTFSCLWRGNIVWMQINMKIWPNKRINLWKIFFLLLFAFKISILLPFFKYFRNSFAVKSLVWVCRSPFDFIFTRITNLQTVIEQLKIFYTKAIFFIGSLSLFLAWHNSKQNLFLCNSIGVFDVHYNWNLILIDCNNTNKPFNWALNPNQNNPWGSPKQWVSLSKSFCFRTNFPWKSFDSLNWD